MGATQLWLFIAYGTDFKRAVIIVIDFCLFKLKVSAVGAKKKIEKIHISYINREQRPRPLVVHRENTLYLEQRQNLGLGYLDFLHEYIGWDHRIAQVRTICKPRHDESCMVVLIECIFISFRICKHIQSNFTMFNDLHHHVGSLRDTPR